MSILGSNMLAGAAGRARYEIQRSLRFNKNDSAYLNRTPGSAGNRRTFTFSCWCKRSKLGIDSTLFSAATNTDNFFKFAFKDDNRFEINTYENGDSTQMFTSARYRDVVAWYHFVVAFDTTQSSSANRVKLYVNGTQVTAFDTNTLPPQNRETVANATGEHQIGNQINNSRYFDGYIAEINQIDGLQLGPEYFGETDLETGAWIPKKYRGSFGTNGFYLNFADNSGVTATTLGKDSSGNGNNFTPNNFQVSTPGGMDSMKDTPTNNWCTLNGAASSTGTRTLSDGNLQADLSGAGAKAVGTFLIPTSGKWYFEMMANDSNSNQAPGVLQAEIYFDSYDTSKAASYFPNGEYKIESANQVSGFSSYTAQDIISFAVDADVSPPEIYFAKNGTWQNSADPAAGTNGLALTAGKRYLPYMQHGSSSSSSSGLFNFGQRQFSYTPPAGFVTLNAKNLPAPTIPNGTKHFNTVLFTGNGSTQSVTGVGFQPDWTWIKMRSDGSRGHAVFDSVRGGLERLDRSSTQEGRTNEGNISFQSDGFNVTSSHPTVNDSSDTAVAWNWLAGGAAVSNGDGSITSEVSVNPEAGFSIVTYTGPGSTETVGHGLGVAPKMIIIKGRKNTDHWFMYNANLNNPTTEYMYWNNGNSANSGANPWNGTAPTSSVFTIVNDGGVGSAYNGNTYVAYCFAEVEGYSKFGKYKGNSGQPDGTFVHTGFKPAFVELKRFDAGDFWLIMDNKRSPHNTRDNFLKGDSDTNEGDYNLTQGIDIYSNGFKLRDNDSAANGNNDDYIYMAFAEVPFKYANAC